MVAEIQGSLGVGGEDYGGGMGSCGIDSPLVTINVCEIFRKTPM